MKWRTLRYSFSLLLCLLLVVPVQAQQRSGSTANRSQAQKRKAKKKEKKKPEVEYPLYNGMTVGLDLWGIGGKVMGSDFLSSEVSVDVNLKNRFFPVAELGYGRSDCWNDYGIHYKTGAPYLRIGMDYNMLFKKAHGNRLLLGLRYATTNFDYDISTPALDDPIYGGAYGNPNLEDSVWGESLPFVHKGLKGKMSWGEFCIGIRAKVVSRIYMGWAMRYRFRLSESISEHGNPYYVPGFGKYGSNTLGITYTISYSFK